MTAAVDPGLDSGLDRTTSGCELDEMSSDDRRFLFCTYEHCHDGLDFKSGCWRKWCRSRAKFYSLHGSHRHKCGAPSRGSTYSYILSRDAEAEGGFRFVSKSTAEGIAVRQELGRGRTDLVWVPAGTQLVPSLQKPPASASGRLRRSNIHSLLSRNRCYRQLERLYCQTSCGCYAGWMCCKLTVSLAGCRCCHRQFVLSRMCIAQCC